MVPKSWILRCLKMCKTPDEVVQFIENHTNLENRIESRREKLSRGKDIKRDALSQLLFVIAMRPLNHILRKCTAGYKHCISQEKIYYLMYMDDIKLSA